jgi:hypothetical protein
MTGDVTGDVTGARCDDERVAGETNVDDDGSTAPMRWPMGTMRGVATTAARSPDRRAVS